MAAFLGGHATTVMRPSVGRRLQVQLLGLVEELMCPCAKKPGVPGQ